MFWIPFSFECNKVLWKRPAKIKLFPERVGDIITPLPLFDKAFIKGPSNRGKITFEPDSRR